MLLLLRIADAACAIETLFPVTHVHTLDPDVAASSRRMDKFVIPQIDADMRKSAS